MGLLDKIRDGYRDASRLFSEEDPELAQQLHDGEGLTGAYNIGVQLATWRNRRAYKRLKKENADAWQDYTQNQGFSWIVSGLVPLPREVGFACRLQGAKGSYTPGSRYVPKEPENVVQGASLEGRMREARRATERAISTAITGRELGENESSQSPRSAQNGNDSVQCDSSSTCRTDYGPEIAGKTHYGQVGSCGRNDKDITTRQWYNWLKNRWESEVYHVDPETEFVTYVGNERNVVGAGTRTRRRPTMDKIREERRMQEAAEEPEKPKGFWKSLLPAAIYRPRQAEEHKYMAHLGVGLGYA